MIVNKDDWEVLLVFPVLYEGWECDSEDVLARSKTDGKFIVCTKGWPSHPEAIGKNEVIAFAEERTKAYQEAASYLQKVIDIVDAPIPQN